MNAPQQVADAIVLARTDYGEADRILTLLTPNHGKLRLMAKGVRRVRSKLAGSIELFSVTSVTFAKGRSDIGTLVSARLQVHYGRIIQDLGRTMLGYDLLKQLNKVIEDEPEAEYFHLLQQAFAALDESTVPIELIRVWFDCQLLRLGGHTPNLQTEPDGTKLRIGQAYEFSFDDSAFMSRPDAPYDADSIKYLRLLFAGNIPQVLAKVSGVSELTALNQPLVKLLMRQHVH